MPCPGTRERASSPSVREGTRGRNFVFLFFLPNFFCEAFPHYLKLSVQIWDNFDFLCYISLVFFVSLNFFAYFEFELQVHEIMEFGDSKNYINDIWCMLLMQKWICKHKGLIPESISKACQSI